DRIVRDEREQHASRVVRAARLAERDVRKQTPHQVVVRIDAALEQRVQAECGQAHLRLQRVRQIVRLLAERAPEETDAAVDGGVDLDLRDGFLDGLRVRGRSG